MSITGSLVGALFLLYTPPTTFKSLVPFLIFTAVLLLAFSEAIKRAIAGFLLEGKKLPYVFPLALQFITGVYGSYFGAGIGIMMLASLSLSGIGNIHTANALKNLLGFVINLVGAFVFALSGKVSWHFVALLMPSFALGGYVGARVSLIFPPRWVKVFIILWGVFIGSYLFVK
ncbi:MAG: sulfite exporter TauE/SafE family protein [Aquificota bacterium]|nr:MAG: sulfite exporter TauE/SafE family protein [Aquificota bacterium]